jgi:hypothetical protein
MSWEAPDSLSSFGILWSHWLHHHLSWSFMISLRSLKLHHYLMHLLGFCDLSDCIMWHLLGFYAPIDCITTFHGFLWSRWDLRDCITTWCISWDFMIITTYITTFLGNLWSSPPASPPLLGFYDHHHLSWDFMNITTSLGILWWSPPLLGYYDHHHMHHHLMQLVRRCIRLWCSEWNQKISRDASGGDAPSEIIKSQEMHFLGFCDFTNCIATWCIS